MIHAKHLSLTLRDGQRSLTALQDINIHIKKGEWVALTGANGSGKSSLVRTFNGLLIPSGGRLTAAGLDLRSAASRSAVKQSIQLVFQSPEAQTIGSTPEEDVAFGLENRGISREEMKARTLRALRRTGLAHKAAVPVSDLSGGERQRLAIACCLALEAEMIIFDEATSMLDPVSRKEIFAFSRELWRRGATVLWVTQRIEEVAAGERAVVMDRGRIIYDGDPRTLFYRSGLPAELRWEDPPVIGIGRLMRDSGWPAELLPLTEQELEEALCLYS
ncbi:energy-coupling factor transport system ATP-binding protein [Paenibacillus forsythiae]|uniref:Energy-coupling factor transport system ATP-binding protein n=2 Tax=Paenibacillus forsythiae TaxID=365616 RepID=A0ABU3H5V9_9BACL|nr:ATP-binding cassette domain-containing protein [Paenibacillus forsythiae]MDT3425447.1 energy-coupling factor transport system ATP-binding protein [Paenibacillus forsythiae]